MSDQADHLPRWARDLQRFCGQQPHFVLSGNVRDRFLIRNIKGDPELVPLASVVWEALRPLGYDGLVVASPAGRSEIRNTLDEGCTDRLMTSGFMPRALDRTERPAGFVQELVEAVDGYGGEGDGGAAPRVALLVEDASRLIRDRRNLEDSEHMVFLRALDRAERSKARPAPSGTGPKRHNLVVWTVADVVDLPDWFVTGSRSVRHVAVPLPRMSERRRVAEMLAPKGVGDDQRDRFVDDLARETDGLGLADVLAAELLRRSTDDGPDLIRDAVRAHKVGVLEDPWSDPALGERIRHGEIASRATILGQDRAITHAFDILKRTVLGLSGAQTGRSARPRGVLFLAGPTGTGKTELARQLSETIFGNEEAYLRFDMSEFAAEHSQARLIGAPPGYVGHDEGGELTRSVREQPFRLLLFDEIEKAHERILDNFLQILDDGRLTDGRGETVHFSETMIVLTSNLGVGHPGDPGAERGGRSLATRDMEPEQVEQTIRAAVERYFTETLRRPELLGRIGDNIVVLDFLRDDVIDGVLGKFLDNVIKQVGEQHGIRLEVADPARAALLDEARGPDAARRGARGMSSVVESRLVNPLARALFDREGALPGGLRVDGLSRDGLELTDLPPAPSGT